MSEIPNPFDLFQIAYWANEPQSLVEPSVAGLTRFQMGVAQPEEISSIFSATAAKPVWASMLSDVAMLRIRLEGLADADLKALALEGGLQSEVALEILAIREVGRTALHRSQDRAGPNLTSLLKAFAGGLVTRAQVASVRALRMPPAAGVYRDGVGAATSWEGDTLLVHSPLGVRGPHDLLLEGDLLLTRVDEVHETVEVPIEGGMDALAIILDEPEAPLVRFKAR